jgi:hypothetical protein
VGLDKWKYREFELRGDQKSTIATNTIQQELSKNKKEYKT